MSKGETLVFVTFHTLIHIANFTIILALSTGLVTLDTNFIFRSIRSVANITSLSTGTSTLHQVRKIIFTLPAASTLGFIFTVAFIARVLANKLWFQLPVFEFVNIIQRVRVKESL